MINAAPHNLELGAHEQDVPERIPVAERLETALGGDLTRFLLSALGKPRSTPVPEPR
jgi:hypothetical protein